MRKSVLGLSVLLAACQAEPQTSALDDPAAIAAVTGGPKVAVLDPQQFLPSDFAQMDDQGASCALYLQDRAVFLARPHFGWIKLDGQLRRMKAQGGAGPLGTRSQYHGSGLRVELVPSGAAGDTASSQPRQELPAQIIITDRDNNTVFGVVGSMRCAVQ